MSKKSLFCFILMAMSFVMFASQTTIDTENNGLRNDPMVLAFDTTLGEGTNITLPLWGTVNVTVDWGDGDPTYTSGETYTVSINSSLTKPEESYHSYSKNINLSKKTKMNLKNNIIGRREL